MKRRSEQKILDQTNELAREFYRLMGYVVPQTHKFYEVRTNTHPTEAMCWSMACVAQELLTDTDVENALCELDLK